MNSYISIVNGLAVTDIADYTTVLTNNIQVIESYRHCMTQHRQHMIRVIILRH